MSEDLGDAAAHPGPPWASEPFLFLTLGICTALGLVFSFGLSRATLVFYSMLISPNCCVMTHSGIVFQVWRQVEC